MFYLDTETCGFQGPCVLLQFALNEQQTQVHDVFLNTIEDTLSIIQQIANHVDGVCGFNLAYDWFHFIKMENMLTLLGKTVGYKKKPIDYIRDYANIESVARDGNCVKPVTALDLMLFARKGPYQSTMDRKEIRIRRVSKAIAFSLCGELERRIPLNPIYFSRTKNKQQWRVALIKDPRTGEYDPEFVDVYLKFSPSSALKAILIDAGLRDASRLLFSDVRPTVQPIDYAYAPVATVITEDHNHWFVKDDKKQGYAWPKVIEDHVYHWKYNARAREYAADDVDDLRLLRDYFGNPPADDDDSVLACMVGAVRWRGIAVDIQGVKSLRDAELDAIKKAPKAPHKVYQWLSEVMSPEELIAFQDRNGGRSTKKVILERIERMKSTCSCVTYEERREKVVLEDDDPDSFGGGITYKVTKIPRPVKDCPTCHGTGAYQHPAAERAGLVLAARKGVTKKAMYDKLIAAGRLHPSASVIGSLSGRMSGRTEVGEGKRASNINALGIQHDKKIRSVFTFAPTGYVLCGGDFAAYEISIADATYNDINLRTQLLTCDACGYVCTLDEYQTDLCAKCGGKDTRRKLHGLFAMELNPGMTYTEILATKGMPKDLYDEGKRSVFSQIYGGDENTIVERIGVDLEIATRATNGFKTRYTGVGRAYKSAFEDHCSMRQPGGIGKKVEWHEPKEYVESLTGFRRWFTLENKITKVLYTLAENPPKAWLELQGQIKRRDRWQTIGNATRSALFGAAFQIQAQCMRAALNHKIQSTGAILTKRLQRRIWDRQESGIHPWRVQPMNIHDELMVVTKAEEQEPIKAIVDDFIRETRSLIPLIRIDWKNNMRNWSEK